MGRKSKAKDLICSPSDTDYKNNDKTKDLYRNRLRSSKQTSTSLKSKHLINDHDKLFHKSTMYTYPIKLTNEHRSHLSNTICSESLTTESAFYGQSISNTSIQTAGDLNNNHVTTLNIENRKRKNSTSSYESLSSEFSQMKTNDILFNPYDTKNIKTKQSSMNNLQLTYHQNLAKRSRFSTEDSIITKQHLLNPSLLIDDDTIDINQLDHQEPLSSSMNNSNSMDVAVKMVQPIVDIIFNAFEDQLKTIQTKSLQSSLSTNSSIYYPLTSPTRPIVLHAVNFNIQLTTKQPTTNVIEKNKQKSNENDNSLNELKEKVLSYLPSNNFINDFQTNDDNQRERRNLKRFVQLAAVGVSVLCSYLFF